MPAIVDDLLDLLPAGTDASLFEVPPSPRGTRPASATTVDDADEAFDDGQFDRAFEFYLRLPPDRKTISRLVSCVGMIGTDEARDRLLALVERCRTGTSYQPGTGDWSEDRESQAGTKQRKNPNRRDRRRGGPDNRQPMDAVGRTIAGGSET